MTLAGAGIWAVVLYLLAIVPAWSVVVPASDYTTIWQRVFEAPWWSHQFFVAVVGAAICTIVYSVPVCGRRMGRLKQHWFFSNFTIALAR